MDNLFTVDLNFLILNDITIDQFGYLKYLASGEKEDNYFDRRMTGNDLLFLESKGFIKIGPEEIYLRQAGHELFTPKTDNFYKFVATFPIKTPSGRYLSPKSLEGVLITKLKKKWKDLFKGNSFKEEHVIKVLEAEIKYRKKTESQEFMQGIEAWLNGANYEKFEYLLEEEAKDLGKNDYSSM